MPLSLPKVNVSIFSDIATVGLESERVLFVGQQNSGTAISGELTTNILNNKSEFDFFGTSPLALAIERFRRRNKVTQVDAIGLDAAGGAVAAGGSIVAVGTATADATLTVYVISQKFNAYTVNVSNTDTATIIGDKIEAAINAEVKPLVTAANAVGTVAITANDAGVIGNTYGIKVVGTIPGVTLTVNAMSGGATDPTLTGLFDVVGNQRYQTIVWQFDSDLTTLNDFLAARFNVDNNVLDGRGFVSITDTYANHLSALATYNSEHLVINVDKLISAQKYKGPNILEMPFVKAAEFAAIRALRRTDNAVLGDLVIARTPLDTRGGVWQNSKPYFNTPFPDLIVPDLNNSFSDLEIDMLLDAGGYVIDANRSYTNVICGEVVTTYKVDSNGNDDVTFKYLNYVDTATACREYIFNNTKAKYAQYRSVSGALLPDYDSANEASIASYVAELNAALGELGLVNTGIGSIDNETIDFDELFRRDLIVTLNPQTGKFFVSFKLYIVTQLRGIDYALPIAFEI